MKGMSPAAAALFEKILRIGPAYFDAAAPLHQREVELCEAMLKAKDDPAEARRLHDELMAVSAQVDAIGEPRH